MSTATMRVCLVTSGEDFSVMVVNDEKLASLDVEVVDCGRLADARVKVVSDSNLATEFVFESGGTTLLGYGIGLYGQGLYG